MEENKIIYIITATSIIDGKTKYYWNGSYWKEKITGSTNFYHDLRYAMNKVSKIQDITLFAISSIEKHLTIPINEVKNKLKRSWFVTNIKVEGYELLFLGEQNENHF